MAERRILGSLDLTGATESKTLAPYPSWDTWKHSLYDFVKQKSGSEFIPNDKQEEVLHYWYIARILYKKRDLQNEDIGDISDQIDEKYEDILDLDNGQLNIARRFITERF